MEIRWLGTGIDYATALGMQEDLAAAVAAGASPETLLMLEHAPVYTIGRLRDQTSLRDRGALPHPVFEIHRGGQATYHGPGQLVGYPILDLRGRGRDLHRHLRSIEQALLETCAALGVTSFRRDGLTGIWTSRGKLASIGVGVKRWVSLHGFALNVNRESLPPFRAIVPCGIDGVHMTCLEEECGCRLDMRQVAHLASERFQAGFANEPAS